MSCVAAHNIYCIEYCALGWGRARGQLWRGEVIGWWWGSKILSKYCCVYPFTLHLLSEAIQELLTMQTYILGSLSDLSNRLQVFRSPVELQIVSLSPVTYCVSIFPVSLWDHIWFGEWKMTRSHYKWTRTELLETAVSCLWIWGEVLRFCGWFLVLFLVPVCLFPIV